jgi:hypothetical protein
MYERALIDACCQKQRLDYQAEQLALKTSMLINNQLISVCEVVHHCTTMPRTLG